MPSADPDPLDPPQLDPAQRGMLLALARQSIEHGLDQGCPLPVVPSDYPTDLRVRRATFVTLHTRRVSQQPLSRRERGWGEGDEGRRSMPFATSSTRGELRGCIGHLEAVQPLVSDVAENAFAAAFRDPRFQSLTRPELARIAIELSVLTPSQPLSFAPEAELLRMLEPGRDGLILEEGAARGTFLPTVWDSLPEPRTFLRHLKQKAGLRPDHWSDRVRVRRYRTESFSE